MATNDLESIAGLVVGPNSKGHQGGAVHGVKVLATGLDLIGEGLALGQTGKTRLLQTRNHVLYGMIRIGAVGEEGACLLGKRDVLRVVGHLSTNSKSSNGKIRPHHA